MKKIQKKYRDLQGEDMARTIARVADGQKALDIIAIDVRGLSGFADYFVIMGGTSTRHVQGLAGLIDREISSKRSKSADTEGLTEGQWILLDYNDVIVHIFHHEIRAHYDLEGLWHDAQRLDLTVPAPVIEEPVVKKPRKKPAGRVIAKAAEQAAEKPAKRPARKPVEKPVKSVRKPTEKVAKKTGKKTAGRPTGKPSGRPSGKPSGKPAGKKTANPVGKANRRPASRPASKTAGRSLKKATSPRRRSTGGAKK